MKGRKEGGGERKLRAQDLPVSHPRFSGSFVHINSNRLPRLVSRILLEPGGFSVLGRSSGLVRLWNKRKHLSRIVVECVCWTGLKTESLDFIKASSCHPSLLYSFCFFSFHEFEQTSLQPVSSFFFLFVSFSFSLLQFSFGFSFCFFRFSFLFSLCALQTKWWIKSLAVDPWAPYIVVCCRQSSLQALRGLKAHLVWPTTTLSDTSKPGSLAATFHHLPLPPHALQSRPFSGAAF